MYSVAGRGYNVVYTIYFIPNREPRVHWLKVG
jgi:hypothetical protein